MGGSGRSDASIQAFFSSTPRPSPPKSSSPQPSSDTLIGDGFTSEEITEALKPKPAEPWQPNADYKDCDIRDLLPGSGAVSFMGRVANILDIPTSQKTPRGAKGCLKLCVKDDEAAITVRMWYAEHLPNVKLGALVTIWTTHISHGDNGQLASTNAPLFASMFPDRDRSCHLKVHEESDDGSICNMPLGYRAGLPLSGVMTLQNFTDGGYDVVDAKILVMVKSIGAKKKMVRKDNTFVENVNLRVHDDTAEATLGLWGTCTASPFGGITKQVPDDGDTEAVASNCGWVPGETVLLIQAPGWKIGRDTYLNITAATIVDVNPPIPDTDWLRRWALRQKSKEAINPPFPEGIFDYELARYGPERALFTVAELDECARATTNETFQGYLSLLIMEVKLLDCAKRQMLFSNECCHIAIYANATTATCKGCSKVVQLRLNPRVLGQVVDETAAISTGKLLFSDRAWCELMGRKPEDLLKLGHQELKHLSDRLLFCRVSVMFGWTGDESKAGGRICVMRVCA